MLGADVGASGIAEIVTGTPQRTTVGAIAGKTAQSVEENIVYGTGYAYPAAEGYTMWQTGQRMSYKWPTPTVSSAPAVVTRYEITPMLPAYEGEHRKSSIWPGSAVQYLDETARQAYKLVIKDGKIHDARGRLFDTSAASTLHSGQGRAIFIMDEHGNFYASNRQVEGKFHHSSLVAGQPVAAAGEIVVSKGELKLISDKSGHYHPAHKFTDQALDALRKAGVDVSKVTVEKHKR